MRLWIILLFQLFDYSAGRRSLFGWRWRKWQGFMRMRKKYAACEVTDPSLSELQRCGKDGISKHECEHERFCCFKDGACFYPTQVMPPQNLRAHALSEHKIELAWNSYSVPYQFELEVIDITNRGGAKVPLQYVAGTQEYTSIGHLHGCHTFRLTLTALDGDGHRQVTKSTFGKTKCSLSSLRPADKTCDFECRDGHFCVTTDNICDGVADCIDGSDELEAMCKVSISKTITTESPLSSKAKSTPLNAAQQSESNSDKSYATFLKNFVSEIFTTAHSAPQKMHKIAAHDEEPPKVFNKQEIKSVICDFVAQNCAREDVLFRTLRQDCPESCSGSFFSWKFENANSSPFLLNGVTEEQLSRLRRYLEEIVNEPDDEMPGCLDKDDCALVIFPAELDVQFSAAQFTQEDGLAFREAISSGGGLAPIEAHGTNNAHVSLMDNNSSMQELGPDSTIVLKPQVSRDSTLERSDKLAPVKNDENRATVEATENLHVKEVPILTSQKGGVMASDDDNQLAAYQQVSTWQQQQRQLDDNETGHQVSDQQDKQQLENFENTRSVNAVDPNRSLSAEVLSAADSVRIENPEVHNLKRQISTDNLQKGGYDKSASGIGGEKDGTSETDARNSNVFQPEMMLKMATENEKLQNEILGSYLMSNSKPPRTVTNNQERFSGVIGKARGDEIPAESLSGSTKTGSYEQTIIRSPTAKPISLQDWLILSGLIHELDYSDTSQSGVLDSYALAHTSWSEEEAPPGGEKHAAKKLNKSPTRGSGTFPERTSKPEVLNNHRDRVAKGDFLTNDDIHLLNEAIRDYVSSTSSSEPKTMEAETYLKPLNELKAFLFTQNGSQNDTSSSSASFQEIHQNNSSEIRSSSDIKDELIINQSAPFTGDETPQTSKNQNAKFSDAPKTEIVSIRRFSEIEAEKQSALESNWQNKEHSIEKSKSNDLLSATESISENVGIDQIKSISSSHVANGESFQNDDQIGGNQSSQKGVLKSENKLASSGVLQTKTDVISSDWEHPVSQQALEPIEIPAQQNDFGGELLGRERSQVSSEDELLDLSRSNSQSESTHGLLELESLDEARIVDKNGSTMLADAGDETAASKQPVSQEQELFKAVPGRVSHVQQHSLSSISSEIDRTLNKENDVNALAENDTYSHSAANRILPKEESKPKLSISGSTDSASSAGAAKQEERKSAKSDSELVENLTSDGKSGAYASAKNDKIEILNDLRLPELLDALRTGGAYSVINKETAKGQDSSSATAKSDIPSSSSSKIAPSASVLNQLKEHTSKIQENHADNPTRQLIEAPNDPESLQLNNPERQNSELKNEEQSTSNLLSLGAEQAPQHATMMSTSVNIPRVQDEYEHPLSSQTDGGVQNRVEGTQPVELNTLSSNNILETIEQTMSTTSEAEKSVPKLPNSPFQQSENLKNRHLEKSSSNKNPSVAEKSDDFTLFVTENPPFEPVTESFRASATRESNLNQAGSAFAGSSKQNVVDLAQLKPDDIIADDIPPNTVASYQVDLGQTDSSNSWQQIPSVDRQSLIGINRIGGDLGSSVSPVYFPESSIVNSAAVETAAVTGNSPNATSHASSMRDDPPQPSVADKLSSNSDSFAAADAESTSAKSQNDKLTSTTGSQTTIQLTDRDTVSQATVIRADEKKAYKGSASTSITDSERSQNRQVNKAAAERTQGENPVKLIQMNENWIDSSNPQITYQAARSDPPMHVAQNVQSAVDPNQIDYARDFENHDFNTVSNAKLSKQGFPAISESQIIYSKTPEAPNQKTTPNKDSQFAAKQAEKALGDERGIEREETVIDEMRASLSASSDTIISENYPQKPKTVASPLVHNVNGGFKDDENTASGVKTPFQIFPDELVASGALLPSSSAEKLSAKKEAQRENNRPSPSAPDKLQESFSRDVFGAQVAKSSQSSQVTSALFCQSLGICNKENRIETTAGDSKSERQSGMRPWSGIDDCTPQCSVVGGKTICSYRKKCMTKSVDLPSLILADVLLNLLRND